MHINQEFRTKEIYQLLVNTQYTYLIPQKYQQITYCFDN